MSMGNLFELVSLAALWGASFLFMRLAVNDFGPVAMAFVRVALASAVLVPMLWAQGHIGALRQHWRKLAIVGLLNSAWPFLCYANAATAITGGLASVFNATTPLWGALIAWLWLGDMPTRARLLGLGLGFLGVGWLVLDKAGFAGPAVPSAQVLAVMACLSATLCYGLSANFTKRYLSQVPPMAIAAGSQLGAAVLLLPALAWWPAVSPGPAAWMAVIVLGLACTGLAYLLFFRLIAHVGPAKAVSVTFLIPAFAVLWGVLFLDEAVTPVMIGACAVIVMGTALATGLVGNNKAR